MMNRHSKKELTRLILTALILAGGSFYGPVAEATEVPITNQTPSDTMPTGLKKETGIDGLNILYATNDNTEISPIKYTLRFSYSGNDDAWAGYSICGGCRYEDIIADSNAEQRTITLTNGKVANVYGGYARGASSTSGYMSSGGVATISGGTVTGNIYGGYSKNGNANTNHVTITGNTFTFTGTGAHAIYGGVGNNNANDNEVTISGGTFGTNVTVYGGWETANNTGGGHATGNTVTINKDNISLKGIYGGVVGLSETSLSPVNSNTLVINANGITLDTVGIQGVATIAFTSGVDFANIISSNGGKVIASSSTLPVLDFTNATGITSSTNGEITVLTATNNLTGIKAKSALVTTATAIGSGLKIKNGTDSDPTAIGSTGVSVIYEKGVHSVKLVGTNTVKYTIGDGAVNTVTLGEMTWNHTNANNTASGAEYTFGSGTTINASGLTFNNTLVEFDGNPLAGTTQKSMTLLSNAANIAGTISQPTAADKGIVNASFTSDGITYTGAAKGTVSIPNSGGQVIYTLNSGTLSTIDLTGWSTASTVPTNWTKGTSAISVSGGFTAPTLEEGESAEILTAGSNLFSDASIDDTIAYNPTAETFEPDSENGVTLSGYKASGVLASSDGTKLLYNYGTKDATNITLGSMTWGTGRTITGTSHTFGNVTGVDATNLAFTFTNDQAGALAASSNMSLLSGATGLTAGKTVTYKNSGTNHTQAVSYSTANGATLSGTLTGTVSTAANAVNYQASSMTLDSIDLSSWNGTASSALPTGWTKNGAISVGGTFTKPTMAAGTSLDILTATSDYFSDADINSAIAYQSGGSLSMIR